MLTLLFAIRDRLMLSDDRGASMVEYALLVVLIAIIAIVAIKFAGSQVSSTFSEVAQSLANS